MAFDFKKEYKEFYMPKNKPEIVTVPKANYIAVRGKGNPNEIDGAYQQAISTFTLKEKIVFFKKKWLHEHISTIVLCVVAWIGIIIWTALKLRGSDSYALLGAIGSMLAILFYVVLYNRMMVYVENHAYRATPDKETETKN